MRVLLTGASGFVGSHLALKLCSLHELSGITHHNPGPPEIECHSLDLTNSRELRDHFGTVKPQVVIHAAALSRVLECEADPALAHRVNVESTQRLATLCRVSGAKLIYFSSDQVFDGITGRYREADNARPLNAYGRTKLTAEAVVLDAAARNLVLRSNTVMGATRGWGKSFTDLIWDSFQAGAPFRAFCDQYRSPIHIEHVVQVVATTVDQDITGVLHVGGAQRLNRVELCQLLAALDGREPAIEAISYRTHPQAAIMPVDTSYTLERVGDICPPLLREPLSEQLAADYSASSVRV
jgi:dTDP-4-dehydrorhamnose reductase